MLEINSADVVADPFPHIIKEGILPAALFENLRADFPTASIFSGQSKAHGSAGSRTGSGFDIYRGDPAFGALVERSQAWREFSGFINSEAFADTFREVFADHLDTIGLQIAIDGSHVDSTYFEPRSMLSETATPGDRVALALSAAMRPFRGRRTIDLFTRLDIHKSTSGYAKPAHCDRPNRLCSLIVYFNDAEAIGMDGGDLLIFKHKQEKPIVDYERHPRPADVLQVAQLRPRPNLGVFFPCQNNSYHGVTPVLSKGLERDFLYINISGRARTLW
jgi:hypothetical protein